MTDDEGNILITFDNILDNTYYDIYITVSTDMPYLPNIFYDDPEVRQIKIMTPENESNWLIKNIYWILNLIFQLFITTK